MALPNGDLITTVFDPQMAYPVDKRMQVDTLNSRDSISMFIRWEGMTVYVLEDSKIYILQGGRSNEYWKELGTGTGTGGTTFVGQFESADLLPTSGRSPGDYAFVGTGDDFVQYNWDSIANEWVMSEGQTDLASEHFHIGYKTPLRRPVIFRRDPKDVIIEDSGDIIIDTGDESANFILTGEVTSVRGIISATDGREIKLINRTGSDVLLVDEYASTAAENRLNLGGSDYTLENGVTISLKSESDRWVLGPVNEVAFSDHLDSVNASRSVGPDGLGSISNIQDRYTKAPVNFKEVLEVPTLVDGIINIQQNSKYYKRVLKEYNLGEFNILPENTAAENATNFAFSQTVIPHDSKVILPTGEYHMDDVEIIKSGIYDFSGVTLINDLEVVGPAIRVNGDAEFVNIIGLNQKYEGIFYTTNSDYEGDPGISKHGIIAENKKTILTNCRATGFSSTGFWASQENGAFYLVCCTANNNGYRGCFSEGQDFQVLGGEYSINGGSNNEDGYGIGCNIYSGDAKVIGTRSRLNRTRNIDSHVGSDIIISNNYTELAGHAHPQWFDKKNSLGLNIRVTQRIDRCIISGNISRRATGSGIAVSGTTGDWHLRDIIISNNILEDNNQQLYVRQYNSNRISIFNNTEINNFNPEYEVSRGLLISPFSGIGTSSSVDELNIFNNSFDSYSIVNLGDDLSPSEKSNINIVGNTFKANFTINTNYYDGAVLVKNNFLSNFSISGNNSGNVFHFTGNSYDAAGATSFTLGSSFSGIQIIDHNIFKNSTATTQMSVGSNTTLKSNLFIVRDEITSTTLSSVIRITGGGNTEASSNKIIFDGVTPFPNPIRVQYLGSDLIIKDNNHPGQNRIEHTGGTITAPKLMWDPLNGQFDFGTSAIPDFGTYDGFKRGDQLKINNVTAGGYVGYVCTGGGEDPVWKKYGIIGSQGAELITADFDLATPPTESFKVYNTAANNFIGSPDDLKDWEITRSKGSDHTVGIDIAIDRSGSGDMYTNSYTGGAWQGWKKINGSGAPDASTTVKGVIELATQTEVNTGTDAVRAVTPETLQGKLDGLILSATPTLNFGSISAGSAAILTATVTGASLGDNVVVAAPASVYTSNDCTVDGWVSDVDEVSVRIINNGESGVDPDEGVFKIKVFK